MPRGRAQRRYKNYVKAKRKQELDSALTPGVISSVGYYKHFNQYNKGKIHCSCGMCTSKTRNKNYKRRHVHANYQPAINYAIKDLKRIIAMLEDEESYQIEN